MDEKVNLKAVENYSKAYAKIAVSPFFSSGKKISGPEILELCETQQINLFVIRELLKSWKLEAQKYKSPFFDYESAAVKEALDHFQNILSNNISIARDHFLPLAQKAISLTVYLILDPYDFYGDILGKHTKEIIKVSELKNEIKYIKTNHLPLKKLVELLEEKKLGSVSGNEAFAFLDQILEEVNFKPEDIEGYINQLSKIHPLNIERLYEAKEERESVVSRTKVTSTPRTNVNKQKKRELTTTVAEDFQKMDLLKDRLTVNQKFMFTKILFNGDFDIFSNAITQLDNLNSLEEAVGYIDSHYPHWDRTSEEFEEFIELLSKRFD